MLMMVQLRTWQNMQAEWDCGVGCECRHLHHLLPRNDPGPFAIIRITLYRRNKSQKHSVTPFHRVITPREGQSPGVFFKIGTFCWPFLALGIARALIHIHVQYNDISWFKEEGWKYFCRFVFVCFTL